jgi:hypothetical protein
MIYARGVLEVDDKLLSSEIEEVRELRERDVIEG